MQIGRTLVFESLEQAASYREYVCQTLRGNCADLVTLCGNKLSGRGVVLGSGFRVLPIEQAPCRFGTIPKGQQVRHACTACRPRCFSSLHDGLIRPASRLPEMWHRYNWCVPQMAWACSSV